MSSEWDQLGAEDTETVRTFCFQKIQVVCRASRGNCSNAFKREADTNFDLGRHLSRFSEYFVKTECKKQKNQNCYLGGIQRWWMKRLATISTKKRDPAR